MSVSEAEVVLEDEVSDAFLRRTYGTWTHSDQAALEARLHSDTAFAAAYRLAEETWTVFGSQAHIPEMMGYRERAIAYTRRSNANRWLRPVSTFRRPLLRAAGMAAVVIATAICWQLSPWGYRSGEYRTGIGEQRIVELSDHSRVILDAKTRMTVKYTEDGRTVELLGGQAQFSVMKDQTRPFKVKVGHRTILALGTVFTVEYVDESVHVAMLEGKVAILDNLPPAVQDLSVAPKAAAVELTTGQEARVARSGVPVVTRKGDLEAATAWREGRVIFRAERLRAAIRRMNRYSRMRLEVDDPDLANEFINGVFEAGDTQGFINALQLYLPLKADYSLTGTVQLQRR